MFLFELTFPFNIYHSGLLKCCFSAEATCKPFVAAAFLDVCCLQCLIPHLNHLTLSFPSICAQDPCTTQRASGELGCIWPPASTCFMSDPGEVFPACCRTSVSSVLRVPKER